jgi:hypothetical protein
MAQGERTSGVSDMTVRHSRREMLRLTASGLGALMLQTVWPGGAALARTVSRPVIVTPRESDSVLSNPWMGWGLWAGPIYFDGTRRSFAQNTTAFGADTTLADWILLDWMWADIQPRRDTFDWSELDEIIKYWAGRGKQICLRVWVTDDPGWNGAPGAEHVCPDWVYEAGLRWHDYTGEGGAKKREPDYADPSFESVFLPNLKTFLQALAERYDKPGPPFCFMECMGYGQWGEWHTMWSKYLWPNKQVKHDTLARIVNLYADTFKHIDLAISYCFDTFNFADQAERNSRDKRSVFERRTWDDPRDFLYRQALDVALERGFLLARHGFIDGLLYTDHWIMEREWTRRALMAEGDWSYLDVKNHGTHGTVNENIDVMLSWHSNYGHFYVDADSYLRLAREDPENFARGMKSGGLGYRLVLTRATYPDTLAPGQLFVIQQNWVNRNVGRLYRRHPLQLTLVDGGGKAVFASQVESAFAQTGWVQGQNYEIVSIFHLPQDLAEGVYEVRVAMVDEQGAPRISLGLEGGDGQKRYRLGTVRIDRDVERN